MNTHVAKKSDLTAVPMKSKLRMEMLNRMQDKEKPKPDM